MVKIGMRIDEELEWTMACCRNLVVFFHQSSQATQALLQLQTTTNDTEGNGFPPVNVIQDNPLRWYEIKN